MSNFDEETQLKTLFPTSQATSQTTMNPNEGTELKTVFSSSESEIVLPTTEETEVKTPFFTRQPQQGSGRGLPAVSRSGATPGIRPGEGERPGLGPGTGSGVGSVERPGVEVGVTELGSGVGRGVGTGTGVETGLVAGAGTRIAQGVASETVIGFGSGLFVEARTEAERTGPSVLRTTITEAGQSDSNSSDGIYPKQSDYTPSGSDYMSGDLLRRSTLQILSKTFINPETLRHESNKISDGPRANEFHVFPKSGEFYDKMETDTLIEMLRKPGESRQTVHDVRQCLLTRRVPRLERSRSISELSNFLTSNDEIVCRRVQESLMNFLLTCEDDQDVGMILKVERNVWTKLRPKQDHVFDLGLLELMLWSYLLCHNNISNRYEAKIKETSVSRKKDIQDFVKGTQSTASSDVFKAMLSFHGDFPELFAKRGGLPLGRDVLNPCEKRGDAVNKLVKDARFCDKFTHLYSLLKMIMASGHDSENILGYLCHIFPSLIGNGSCGKTQTLAMLLVKGCMYLLQNVYKEAEVQIGPVKDNTKQHLASLIERCIENLTNKNHPSTLVSIIKLPKFKVAQKERLQYIISEVSPLIFHRCRSVRDPIHALVSKFYPAPMLKVFIEEIERRQANCGLKISSKAEETDNFFQTLNGSFGTTKVIIHAHTPCYEKLHNVHAEQQVSPDKRPERDRHINNLDILRKLPSHPNIVELFAYQVKPYPWYYIVEDCQQMTLLRLVLQRRKSHRWISDLMLCDFLIDIVHGLSALHEQGIVLRDPTLQNFFLVGDVVKIGDVSRAFVYKNDSGIPVKDFYPGDIPTRWTSPEALLEGSFTPWSDIWALGLVIYALFTHGCDPYTEYYRYSTEVVMRMVVFEEILPFHWSCIPDDLYALLKQCMRKDPQSRIQLSRLKDALLACRKDKLDNESQGGRNGQTTTFDEIHARDMFYPIIDERQDMRHHLPERGLPPYIHKFRKDKIENVLRREWHPTAPQVSHHELHAQSDVIVVRGRDEVIVQEPMTQSFVTKRLPHIQAANLGSLQALSSSLENHGSNHYIQVRTYGPGDTLLNTALTRSLDDPVAENSTLIPYLELCLQAVQIDRDLQQIGLIHRDTRAKNFLVDQRTKKVYACRTSRIFPVPESGIVQDRIFRECSRWLPPEALFDGIYSKKGDVYMLAMMIYEVILAYEINDITEDKQCVPYCMEPHAKLAEIKQKGEFPEKPKSCPEWLYDFLKRCWNPDRCDRPDIDTMVCLLQRRLLEERCIQHARQNPFILSPQSPTTDPPRMRAQTQGGNFFRRRWRTLKAKLKKRRVHSPSTTTPPDSRWTIRSERIYASVNENFVNDEAAEEIAEARPEGSENEGRFSRRTPQKRNNVTYRQNPGRRQRKPSSKFKVQYSSSSERSRQDMRKNRKVKKRGRLCSQSMWVDQDMISTKVHPRTLSVTREERLQPSPSVPTGHLDNHGYHDQEFRAGQQFTHWQNSFPHMEDRHFQNGSKGRSVTFVTPTVSATSQDSDTVLTVEGQLVRNNTGTIVNNFETGISQDVARRPSWQGPGAANASVQQSINRPEGIIQHYQGDNGPFDNLSNANDRRPVVGMPTGRMSASTSCIANTTREIPGTIHDDRQALTDMIYDQSGRPVFGRSSSEQITQHSRGGTAHGTKEKHFDETRKVPTEYFKPRKLTRSASEGSDTVFRQSGTRLTQDHRRQSDRHIDTSRRASEYASTRPQTDDEIQIQNQRDHRRQTEGHIDISIHAAEFASTDPQRDDEIHFQNQGESRNGAIGPSVSLSGTKRQFWTGPMTTDKGLFTRVSSVNLFGQAIGQYHPHKRRKSDSLRNLTRGSSMNAHLPFGPGVDAQSNEEHVQRRKKFDPRMRRDGSDGFMTSSMLDQVVRTNNNRTSEIRSSVVNYVSDGESND